MWLVFSGIAVATAVFTRNVSMLWVVPAMLPLWAVVGFLWGFLMKTFMSKKPKFGA